MQEDDVIRFQIFIRMSANLFGQQTVHGVKVYIRRVMGIRHDVGGSGRLFKGSVVESQLGDQECASLYPIYHAMFISYAA